MSPACDRCYARRLAERLHPKLKLWGPGSERLVFGDKHWNDPVRWNRKAEKARLPRLVFTNSMADVFDNHPACQDERERLFELVRVTPWLRWLMLTKRIGNVPRMLPADWLDKGEVRSCYRNVWLGISVVTQEEFDRDVPRLLEVPAAVRFLSIEPMLGPINLGLQREARDDDRQDMDGWCSHITTAAGAGLHWVITGGESGTGARPSHPGWFRSVRDQCAAAGVPFHHKQNGEWVSVSEVAAKTDCAVHSFPDGATVRRVGKNDAGRTIDGAEHIGFPKAYIADVIASPVWAGGAKETTPKE